MTLSVTRSDSECFRVAKADEHDGQTSLSLLECAIEELLFQTERVLQMPVPRGVLLGVDHVLTPEGRETLGLGDTQKRLVRAGYELCGAVPEAAGLPHMLPIFNPLNRIALLRYEGAPIRGSIAFVADEELDFDLRLRRPVQLTSYKAIRKLLEVSPDRDWICAGPEGLSGVVKLVPEHAFRVKFTGHGKWSLWHGSRALMDCALGIPSRPRARLRRQDLENRARALRPSVTTEQIHRIWKAVELAMDQAHGTMLVIAADAEAEAERLSGQALCIEPRPVSELPPTVGAVDGAVLVDWECTCFAIGAILDGIAGPDVGDPARGARYNSACRYVATRQEALCVVVSEDGDVDLVSQR
ncbi:MAG: diadenylate cyclase [Polyangiaceae bacterium]